MAGILDKAKALLGGEPDEPERPPRPSVDDAADRIAPGEVIAAREGDADVAVFSTADGRIYVVQDACPHQGAPLSNGFVEDNAIVCDLHGWMFDADTGKCAGQDMGLCPRRIK